MKAKQQSCRTPGSQRTLCSSTNQSELSKKSVKVKIDNRYVTVPAGTTILQAAQKLNIHIPTLCTHEDLKVVGNCRICSVKVAGHNALQAACAYPLTKPVEVRTYGPDIRKVRKNIVELMISDHCGTCATCSKSGSCELEKMTAHYGINHSAFAPSMKQSQPKDVSSKALVIDMDKCILCRRCVRTCIDIQEVGTFDIVGKGHDTGVSTFFNRKLKDAVCIGCGQCVVRCPTGALSNHDETGEVWTAIDSTTTQTAITISPFVRMALAEMFDMPPGTVVSKQLVTALKRCGFDYVYDTNVISDLYMIEQINYLLGKIWHQFNSIDEKWAPIFSSECPGWVSWIEHFEPGMIDNLFPFKSPEQIMGAIIKGELQSEKQSVVTVAAVPCAAKKQESLKDEMRFDGSRFIDTALTTVELGQMIKAADINLLELTETPYDLPGFISSGYVAGGVSQGMVETLIFHLSKMVTGAVCKVEVEHPLDNFHIELLKIKIEKVTDVPRHLYSVISNFNCLKGEMLFGKCTGTANAKLVLQNIKDGGVFSKCIFIDFSACLDGCAGGGGQPSKTSESIRHARKKALAQKEPPRHNTKNRNIMYTALHKSNRDLQQIMAINFTSRGKFMV